MQKFYVTTSIPYVNGTPHIGNVLDSVYADVLARYHRHAGDDVRFLTGTDEHGSKIARSAKAAGVTPQDFVDKNSFQFKKLKDVLNLSWDDFIRTSDQTRHWPGAQKLWNKLAEAGDLYKKAYKGLYCVGHEAFITEKDLVEGVCQDHQTKPEIIEEENYFFKLSKYTKEIERQINLGKFKVVPESRRNEILSLLSQGLEDVSFSRPAKDLSWGVPVPGDSSQTMYVWADALVNYISALGYGSSDEKTFEKYWPADVQVIGKDNLRFHAAIWPGMLLAAKLPLPEALFVHGFLNVNGQKISKTVGNVIDPAELVAKYGTDAVRFYLLREVSPFEDGDFSYEKFEQVFNANLANGLGNFAARVLALGEKAGELTLDSNNAKVKEILALSGKTKEAVAQKISEFKFHEALAQVWKLISEGDAYVNNEKPWEPGKQQIIGNSLLILEQAASLLKPFLPEAAEKILACMEVTGSGTLKVKKCPPLFPRIEPHV